MACRRNHRERTLNGESLSSSETSAAPTCPAAKAPATKRARRNPAAFTHDLPIFCFILIKHHPQYTCAKRRASEVYRSRAKYYSPPLSGCPDARKRGGLKPPQIVQRVLRSAVAAYFEVQPVILLPYLSGQTLSFGRSGRMGAEHEIGRAHV